MSEENFSELNKLSASSVKSPQKAKDLNQWKLTAVIGRPIFHSRSPLIFNRLFDFLKIKAHYIRLASTSLEEALAVLQELNIPFFNVTSPYKEKIINLLDEINPEAQLIGAVNTVIKEGKKLKGFNTDWQGFLWSVKDHWLHLKKYKILVLGAGGAARAVLYALNRMGCRFVVLTNRTQSKGKRLAHRFGYSFLPLLSIKNNLNQFDLVISCLPKTADLLSSRDLAGLNLIEAAYGSASNLASKASGLEWLLGQAIEACSIFTRKKISSKKIEEIRQVLFDPEPKKRNIALIGFMGCGKSEVGRLLAAKMRWNFVDTDELIEKEIGQPIKDIIERRGEGEFRKIEATIIPSLLSEAQQTVFALGGGSVISEQISQALTKTCYVVWLWTPLENILSRIPIFTRPLLHRQMTPEDRKNLFLKRIPFYSKSADLLVPNKEGHLIECVRLIYDEISPAL